jgi:uncharacterized protein (TIGR02266 family)
MDDSNNLERRRAFRAPVSLAVELRDGQSFSIHSIRDLSIGGVYFAWAVPHSVGAKVRLRFQLPGDPHTIECEGEVVSVPDKGSFGMGVRFLEVAPEDAARLEAFVRELMDAPP